MSGLRPIELASCLQLYRFMNCFFSVPDIYISKTRGCVWGGFNICLWCFGLRIHNHQQMKYRYPLYRLLHMMPSKQDDDYTRIVFTRGWIVEWANCEKKVSHNMGYITFTGHWPAVLCCKSLTTRRPKYSNMRPPTNYPIETEHGTLSVLNIISLFGLVCWINWIEFSSKFEGCPRV